MDQMPSTAFVDTTARDLGAAVRSIGRAPLTAFTIVATVSTGLGVVAVLFTLLNTFVFRVDQVPDVAEMYAMQGPEIGDGAHARFTRPQFEAVRRETSVFTDAYAEVTGIDLRVDGQVIAVTLVTGNFFQVARVNAAMGRVLGTADDRPSGGNRVMVLSDRGWTRRFNRDPHVLGRTVLVNGMPFDIIGVTPAGFRGLAVGAPDVWAPLSQLTAFSPGRRGHEDGVGVDIIGRLQPGLSKDSARAQLSAWNSNQPSAAERRVATVELVPHQGTVPQPMEAVAIFTPLFLAFGLILLIGCANVANLLLARGVARQREIGIRLAVGASRGRIVRQLMTESLLLALVSAAGGYLVSRVALQGTIGWILRVAPVDIGDINLAVPAADWRVALFLVVAAIMSTAFFALMPALQATRIDPVRTLRGELVTDGRPGRARNLLIGVQVFASALLLICAAIFLRSGIAAATYDPGLRTADTVMIGLGNEKRAAMVQAIAAEPEITQYAAIRPEMLDTREGFATTGTGRTAVGYKFVSGAYFDVMGIPLLRGRTFSATEREGQPIVVVSESIAKMLWPDGDAIGQTLRIEPAAAPANQPGDQPSLPSPMVTVVGVSRDIKGFRFSESRKAVIFLPTTLNAPNTEAMARVASDPDRARQTLLDHLTRIDPNLGMIVTMRTVARLETFLLDIAFRIAFVLGSIALLLTVSGLFSVLSYLVAQRTREIGVRMALGATAPAVARLMMSQTARPVLSGLLAGAALAGTLATVLRSTLSGSFITQVVHMSDPVAYAAGVLVIAAACIAAASIPAARASRLDPVQALRQD